MFVGESGVGRIIQRTCETMAAHRTDEAGELRALGVIDLPTIQRYLNFHFSVTMDLFGSDVSSNAATFYTTGLKGRRVGGAVVSEKHANFIVNDRKGTAADVRRLAEQVRAEVRARHGTDLAFEVEFVGDWTGWTAEEP